eukprot:COSAG05_NODE_2024_length_3677_cov_2.848239_6_plen_114_part_00
MLLCLTWLNRFSCKHMTSGRLRIACHFVVTVRSSSSLSPQCMHQGESMVVAFSPLPAPKQSALHMSPMHWPRSEKRRFSLKTVSCCSGSAPRVHCQTHLKQQEGSERAREPEQ